MPRAVIYARTSTEEQTISLEEQVRICRDWCMKHNIEILLEIREHASGATPPENRPEFKKIFELVRHGIKPDFLVVYSLDRLTRSLRRLLTIMLELSKLGITVISVQEEWTQKITDPTIRDLITSILGFFAEWWLKEIRRRTREAVQSQKVKKKLEKIRKIDKIPDEVKDAVVTLYTFKGYSIKKLAKMFNLSEYAIRKILVERGVLSIGDLTCPRCLHRLEWDDVARTFRCRYCGYIKNT